GLRFRDNLRQANVDKQFLLAAIHDGLDVSGDGVPDFDGSMLHYVGGSLGGIMGGEFTARSPELHTSVLLVPGARIVDILREQEWMRALFIGATAGDLQRLYPVLQTSFDRGDPGAHAGGILEGDDAPHLLMQVALDDNVVVNRTSVFFAQTLKLPILGDVIVDLPGAPVETDFPIALNRDNRLTAGFYAFDIICTDDSCTDTEPAGHRTTPFNVLATTQVMHFIDTLTLTGIPEVIDVYRTKGVK
ncbi:MAG: hypothetical protein AAF654_14410, partial [Myxococcota bacterium]